jgi:hypothetical protein
MKINTLLGYFFICLSFLCSFYFVRDNDLLYLIFYSLFLICLLLASIYYLHKSSLKEINSFIQFFKYLIIFYVIDFFLQTFYHNIALTPLIIHSASSVSAILCIFLFSKIIEKEIDFIKINKLIFYLLNISLAVGIIDSLGILNFNFLAQKKLIEAYNFGIFKNTAGLMEHQISFGIANVLLFVISTSLKKINFKNLPYPLLLLLGVFISFSRTALLLLFICFLIFIFNKKSYPKFFFSFGFFLFFVILLIFDFSQIEFINQILRLESGLSGREFIFGFFLTLPFDFKQLLFGFGFQNIFELRDSILTDFELSINALQFRSFHNLYLSTISNSGLLLTLLYFTSQLKIYYDYIRLKKKYSNYVLLIAVIFIIGNLFVEFKVGGIRIISIYFAIILAYIYKYKTVIKDEL